MKRDDEPKTMIAVRIKRKHKRLIKELLQAMLIIVGMALFFGSCWVFDVWSKKP